MCRSRHVTAPVEEVLHYALENNQTHLMEVSSIIDSGCDRIRKLATANEKKLRESGLSGIPFNLQVEKDGRFVKDVTRLLQNLKEALVNLGKG